MSFTTFSVRCTTDDNATIDIGKPDFCPSGQSCFCSQGDDIDGSIFSQGISDRCLDIHDLFFFQIFLVGCRKNPKMPQNPISTSNTIKIIPSPTLNATKSALHTGRHLRFTNHYSLITELTSPAGTYTGKSDIDQDAVVRGNYLDAMIFFLTLLAVVVFSMHRLFIEDAFKFFWVRNQKPRYFVGFIKNRDTVFGMQLPPCVP